MMGVLYIVATPIGNLEDITLRALRVLSEVDTIFCEDTRVTGKLLHHHGISAKMQSLNARTEDHKLNLVVGLLSEGQDIAYVSDAGTPGISDPGVRLVSAVKEQDIEVVAIPGPSAVTTALSIAGVPTNKFTFLGFLPQKKGRQTALKDLSESEHTIVLYESTHRILKLLKELQDYVSINRHITLARELTKMHEEILQGSAEELLKILESNPQKQKGEFVVIVSS
ncbi:MAG: 16S rRNA (cytidine(1402)-2'-O)-methyltransferase [Candidatus Pacebacteria bacterium]|nr:16S rRNA (cytidine(1402)-2'-O)-methyltransferase [Candidatus Paceibacterota bacterium]